MNDELATYQLGDPSDEPTGWAIPPRPSASSAMVEIPDLIGPFPAEVLADTWNGWACPRFTREVAEQIVEVCNLTEDMPTFTFDGPAIVGDGERYMPDQDGLYGLGAFAWTWEVMA